MMIAGVPTVGVWRRISSMPPKRCLKVRAMPWGTGEEPLVGDRRGTHGRSEGGRSVGIQKDAVPYPFNKIKLTACIACHSKNLTHYCFRGDTFGQEPASGGDPLHESFPHSLANEATV